MLKWVCICADVAQPDQARIVGINAQYFLKNAGNFVISIKASCIDSTAPPEAVFAREVSSCSQQRIHACCTFMSEGCDCLLVMDMLTGCNSGSMQDVSGHVDSCQEAVLLPDVVGLLCR
jgi:hypothetical protein